MKKIFLLCILSGVLYSCSNKVISREIKYTVTFTQSYCGGAVPSEEIISELRNPRPFEGSLYIHKNADRSDQAQQITCVNGETTLIGLTEGQYYIFKDQKITVDSVFSKYIMDNPILNPECLLQWNKTPIENFTVDKNTTEVSSKIHLDCNPCEPPRP